MPDFDAYIDAQAQAWEDMMSDMQDAIDRQCRQQKGFNMTEKCMKALHLAAHYKKKFQDQVAAATTEHELYNAFEYSGIEYGIMAAIAMYEDMDFHDVKTMVAKLV